MKKKEILKMADGLKKNAIAFYRESNKDGSEGRWTFEAIIEEDEYPELILMIRKFLTGK